MATTVERYGAERSTKSDLGLQTVPTRELFRDFMDQSERLVREQIGLAKAELRDEMKSAAKASAVAAGGGVTAHVAYIVLAFCVVYAIGLGLPLWLSALIVGGALAIAAGLMVVYGRTKLQQISVKPPRTMEMLGEDRRWAQETMRDIKSHRRANA